MTGTWSPPPAWTLTSGGWTTTSRQSRRWSAMRRTYSSTRLSPRHRGGSSPASSPPATSLWVKQNSMSSYKLFIESRKVKALSSRQQKLSNIDLNLNQLAFLQWQASSFDSYFEFENNLPVVKNVSFSKESASHNFLNICKLLSGVEINVGKLLSSQTGDGGLWFIYDINQTVGDKLVK